MESEKLNGKWALYMRVSKTDMRNSNQRIILEKYANENGLVYDLFEEKESTRRTRPVKAELINRIRANEYVGVIITKLDRFARSSSELILEIEEFLKKGKTFISINDNLDFGTASGRLHFQILAAFSEFERALISQRTREGLARVKAQGTKLGRPRGSRDKKKRRIAGYLLRAAASRQNEDRVKGHIYPLEDYINKKRHPEK